MSEYYTQAISFCNWAKNIKEITSDNAETVAVKIMELYIASAKLKYPEDIGEATISAEREFITFSAGQFNVYWEFFNPYICDEPVCGCLVDDINDIYNDIREGICSYEQGLLDEAVWIWKWNFDNHWKHHAADAIRALSNIITAE